jgi:hypothetical protein
MSTQDIKSTNQANAHLRAFGKQLLKKRTAALVLVLVAVVLIGQHSVFQSHAAASFVAAEAENGTITAPAMTVSDAAASNAKAVRFMATTPVPTPEPVPLGVAGNWTLKFDDEFNGTILDTSKWTAMQTSMNNVETSPSNVAVSGGDLILTLASSSSGAEVCACNSDGSPGNFYALPVGGYAEARVYFPGNGTAIYNWPAWWASGPNWPAAGENDIAEGLGTLTDNYHSPSGSHNQGTVPGVWSNAFHVYGIYRESGKVQIYYDGNLVRTYTTDDNGGGESLILNVGSGNTAAYGTASQVKVDYVRAWQ